MNIIWIIGHSLFLFGWCSFLYGLMHAVSAYRIAPSRKFIDSAVTSIEGFLLAIFSIILTFQLGQRFSTLVFFVAVPIVTALFMRDDRQRRSALEQQPSPDDKQSTAE